MSIVLVIIGLVVGGILVGQNLVDSARARAQISQVQQYQAAVATFREKYGGVPGDLNQAAASQFGFIARGGAGQGDGNGILQGCSVGGSSTCSLGWGEGYGEVIAFWADLSAANLIEQNFITGSETVNNCQYAPAASCFPAAKIGNGSYLYVYSSASKINYFGLSSFLGAQFGIIQSTPSLSVQQAAAIDSKIDDGLPQSGNVIATYLGAANFGHPTWAAGGGVQGANNGSDPPISTTAATPGSTTTCYDNSSDPSGTPGISNAVQHYSVEISNGSMVNCALSFKFQTGD